LRSSKSAISADAGRLQRLDHDLVRRFAREGGELARGDHLQAFLRLEAHLGVGELPDHGIDLGALVLQREIAMAGRMRAAEAGNLAAYPHAAIGVLHCPLQRSGQFGDGEFRRVGKRFGHRRFALLGCPGKVGILSRAANRRIGDGRS
jgi:hypothetical protein